MDRLVKNNLFTGAQILIIGLMIFIPLFGASPFLGSDAVGYIHFYPTRPPIYPIFIWLFHGFGRYQFIITMWAQATLVFISLLYARYWLQKNLKLPQLITFLILSFTVTVNFLDSKILTFIYSEGIAFSLFTITFLLLVENFKTFGLKKFIFMVISGNLLILTRGQFNFLYLIFLLLPIWQFWKLNLGKRAIISLMIIIISILFSTLCDKGFHYFLYGEFKGSSAVWRMFAAQPLYLADVSDAKYFENPDERKAFINIIQKLEKEHLTRKSAPSTNLTQYSRISYDYFNDTFSWIEGSYGTLYSPDKMMNPEIIRSEYQFDHLMFNIAKTLILHNLKENLILYFWKVTSYFATPWLFPAFLLTLIVILFRILTDKKWFLSMNQLFIAISFIFILANACFIALFQSYSPRYFYYTYFVCFCLSGLLANKFLVDA